MQTTQQTRDGLKALEMKCTQAIRFRREKCDGVGGAKKLNEGCLGVDANAGGCGDAAIPSHILGIRKPLESQAERDFVIDARLMRTPQDVWHRSAPDSPANMSRIGRPCGRLRRNSYIPSRCCR